DTADEPDETFTLSLSSPANATLGDNQGVGTITDDDPTPFCALVSQIPRAECEALEAIYNSTGGPNWVRKTGWFTTYTPCSWQDIYCTGGHVRYLGLGQNNLNGTLPPEIGNLSALTNLDFNNNVLLTGGIPPEIGSLTNLKRLIFYNTSVGGSIPPEIGLLVNVEDLSLQRCNLTGELPPELGNLTHVVNLGLGNNYLTGTIPPELGNLPVVREIHLSLNQLTGEVPAALMSAPELRAFYINDNRLSASDPVVKAWLDIVSEEWETQTVPPKNIHSAYAGDTSIYPGWTPIPYTANGGYYEVVYSATSGGPYTAGCTTANKLANTCGVSGLTPNTPYYFVVRTFTPAHDLQLNDLWSTPSSEIMISTVIRDIAHPAAPTLSAPADRSNTTDTTPLLKWSKPTGATQYRLQVDDDPAFGSPANMGTDTILTTSYTVPTLNALPYGQYYWRVQAGNAANAWGDWSLIRRFTITLLKSPANATHLTDTTPTLSWTKPTGATAFEFKLDDSDSPVVMPFNTGLLTSYTPALLPNGEYWWSVRVLVGGTWSDWMPAWTFTITAPPTIKPALLTPLNGAIWPDLTPIFTWSSVAGGDHYQIQIDETSSFSSPVQDVTLGEGILTYTATPLLDGGKYFWRVRAINGTGVAGAWSGSYNFTLAQLSAPVLTSPLNKSAAQDRTPTFAWNVLVGAASYQIQISSDPNFVTVTHQGDTGTNGYTLPDLNALPDGVYTWRVRAINGLIIPGKWSSKWALIIDNTGPAAPVLSSPAFNSGTPDTTPTFTWKAPKDGKTYRIQVTGENDPTFAAMVINEPIPVTTFTPGTALDFDDYLWRVQALDVLSNAGDFSPASRFNLTLHKSPADGAASTVTQPTFIWNALTGATAYDFELATDAEFTDVIYPYNGPNKSFKPTAVLEQGTYYWHVKTDISGWMPAWTIIITPPLPAKPVLTAPASKVLLNDNTPTLSWNAVTGITKYQIQVDNNTDFSSPAQDVIVSNLLNYIASELPDGTYTWRVRAINGVDAAGAWSSAFSLTIDTTPPAVPVVTAPVDNTSMTNTRFSLAWNKVNDAARYEVQIDLNLAFLLPLSDVGNKTSYKPATPLARGIYVWHVRAVDKAGNASGWSPARSFEIVAGVTSVDPTPAPTLEITPTDVPVEPTLEPTLAPTATLEPTLIPPDVPLYTLESDDPAVTQTGLWTVYDTPYASGGHYLYSSGSLDDALTLHFSGVQLDVIFVKHPALGQFVVEVDGAPLLLMNSYAPEAEFGVRASISLSAGEHIARLYPLSGTIAIDAFTVHSRIIPPAEPTLIPTLIPTFEPTVIPPELPTIVPPVEPTLIPTLIPTEIPTEIPTLVPTDIPTLEPTLVPTEVPTEQPPIEPTPVPVEPERTTT
ncbi:MAG: hypothetical protein HY866_16290, partial [Chloroflexi bacterium]|nr:hypothetical protein [Chloroflexota bacterium]